MRVVYTLTYVMAFLFLAGKTARRGIRYFAVNVTTMLEDYLCGIVLLVAAWTWCGPSDRRGGGQRDRRSSVFRRHSSGAPHRRLNLKA